MNKYKAHVKKYSYCFILGPTFLILEACGEFLLPYLNANIINIGAANGDVPYILKNGLYMLLIAAFMLITGIVGAGFSIKGAAHMAAGVRHDVFCKIQQFSFANLDQFSTGSLITRVTNDITQIQNFSQTMLRGIFRSPVMLVGALCMSFIMNPRLALIVFAVVPFLVLAIALIIKISSPRYTAMQEQIDCLNTGINETVTNERVIKSFVREEHEKGKFSGINEALRDKCIRALKVMLLLQPISALAINAATLAIVWVAGRQIMVGSMEVGTLTAFITYLSQVLNALNFLVTIFLQGTRALASDRRISEVLNTKIDLDDTQAAYPDRAIAGGSIEFRNVSFRYYKENHAEVLDNINLQIDSGSLVGIIGSTGSGKTTLVSLIPRLYDTDKGEVLVDGVNVRDLSLRELRESIAMVLQKNTLFSGTIAENLRWGNESASMDELIWAAKIAHADDFIQAFPDGYETELNQGGVNLSGGQKQRVCIARALLKRPKILILDDSTSAVDTATEASIRAALRQELHGMTKIIIAQRITSVIDADQIIVLDEGQIVGCGSHAELIQTCVPYQEIYHSQVGQSEEEHHES